METWVVPLATATSMDQVTNCCFQSTSMEDMQPSPNLSSFDKEEGPTSRRRGVLKYDGTTLSSLHQIARLPTDEMKIREGSMITNLRERIQVSQSQPRGNPKNKVKCLAINQVLRAKDTQQLSIKMCFYFMWYYFLPMSVFRTNTGQ